MTLRRVLGTFGGLLLAIPVLAIWRTPDLPLLPKLLAAGILLATLGSPVWGLCAVTGLLPISRYFFNLSGQPFDNSPGVAEMLLAPFLLGAAVRFVAAPRAVRTWLDRPALVLGCVVAVAGGLELAAQQQATAWPGVFFHELRRHVVLGYYDDVRSFAALHGAAQWIEGLTLAVFVERLVREDRRASPVLMRTLLASVSIGAAFSWNRLAEIALRRPHPLAAAVGFLYGPDAVRISPLYLDVNAAASIGALFFVTAVWLAFRTRQPLACLSAVLLALALWVTHSRAALAAALVSLCAMWLIRRQLSRGRFALVAAGAALVLVGLTLVSPSRVAQSSSGDSLRVRARMTRIGLRLAAEHPMFGVGLGEFQHASQAFITPEFAAFFPQAAHGENAHNNFVQILAELGLVGLAAFVWLLAAPARSIAALVAAHEASHELTALAGGLAAFLLTCLLGHPLLTVEVLWLFLLLLGVTAGLASGPAAPRPALDRTALLAIAVVLVSAPVRWWDQQRTADLDHVVIGASQLIAGQDGVSYRLADPLSAWYVSSSAHLIEIPMRLTADSQPPCLVHIEIDGRPANVVEPVRRAWLPVAVEFRPSGRDPASRRVELRVDGGACHLMVGELKTRQ